MNDDDLFNLFVMGEIDKEGKKSNRQGSCLTCLLLIVAIPVVLIIGIVTVF